MADESTSGVPEEPSLLARRPALGFLMKSCAAAWAVGMGIPAGSYLWPALHQGPGLKTLNAATPNEIPVGGFKLVQAAGKPIIVIRSGEKKYEALSAICMHLGCLVQWRKAEKDIFCPCHGGRYDLQGKVLGGPPPRPLSPYPVTVVGGEVQVKLSAD